MRDKNIGLFLMIISFIGVMMYIYWFFGPPFPAWLFIIPGTNLRWALVIPIIVVVLTFFFIFIWIGWTMVVTPPLTTIEEELKKMQKDEVTEDEFI